MVVGSKSNTKEIYYIEQKCDAQRASLSDRGPAWIDLAEVTRTGSTIYSRGLTFKRVKGGGPCKSNYLCSENKCYYRISGVKKDGNNRHYFGSGKVEILIDKKLLPESWQNK